MKKTIAKTVAAIALVILIGIDLASTLENPARSIAVPLSQLKDDGVSEGYSARVSLVRSDDSALPNPTALTSPLTAEQVFAMVAEAIETSGDLAPQLFAGAKITIKPNAERQGWSMLNLVTSVPGALQLLTGGKSSSVKSTCIAYENAIQRVRFRRSISLASVLLFRKSAGNTASNAGPTAHVSRLPASK